MTRTLFLPDTGNGFLLIDQQMAWLVLVGHLRVGPAASSVQEAWSLAVFAMNGSFSMSWFSTSLRLSLSLASG
jgi:hypothetical protein